MKTLITLALTAFTFIYFGYTTILFTCAAATALTVGTAASVVNSIEQAGQKLDDNKPVF